MEIINCNCGVEKSIKYIFIDKVDRNIVLNK